MLHRTLLAVALIASAGAVHAQTAAPVDPYGRPLLGRNDWVRQPGDQPGPVTGAPAAASIASTVTTTTAMGGGTMSGSMVATPPPATMPPTASAVGEPLDPYGRPLIGRNDWVRQPGDQRGPTGAGASVPGAGMASGSVASQAETSSQIGSGPHPVAFKDENGFRYDSMGNRLDARGYVISPQTR